jgi:hypothetical protein
MEDTTINQFDDAAIKHNAVSIADGTVHAAIKQNAVSITDEVSCSVFNDTFVYSTFRLLLNHCQYLFVIC